MHHGIACRIRRSASLLVENGGWNIGFGRRSFTYAILNIRWSCRDNASTAPLYSISSGDPFESWVGSGLCVRFVMACRSGPSPATATIPLVPV